jgi:hypothetical protein
MEALSTTGTYTIADNVIRGLPGGGCHMYITATTATSVDFSNDPTMASAKNSVPATDPVFSVAGSNISAGFMRVNGGSAIVRTTKR